ncbi:MAG: sirohydrochlorin cobaltochelatase [Candidatus Adiutrix sp.]|jgi:sirohydrochlorin cobaltochelatase|nr:sirohydrochlorin cobaltochelatase [Candidatus Adiutrix sp.]
MSHLLAQLSPAVILAVILTMVLTLCPLRAAAFERTPQKPALVLAAFGTTEAEALKSILNIRDRVAAAFPGYDVHLAFTSNIIRDIWRQRAGDAAYKAAHPGIPREIYEIGNTLTVLANIQETGARLVLVQSLHITDGEEYRDLANLVNTLAGLKPLKAVLHPFPWIGLGDPALGTGDGQPQYLERAATALAPLAEKARKSGAALVLMGHGNEHLTQAVYGKFQAQLRQKYGSQIYIGTVEAPPLVDDVIAAIGQSPNKPRSVLLAPMMVVAGDHARNDMAGDEDDSWASKFKASGYEVAHHLEGLGSNDSWADIYVEHLKALELKVVKAKEADGAKAK